MTDSARSALHAHIKSATPQDDTERALVAVEAAERLAVKAHAAMRDGGDRRAELLLVQLVAVTSQVTASLVKDQDRSDRISRAAGDRVRQALDEVY